MNGWNSKTRSQFLKKAHHLKPVVMIGKAGLTAEVLTAIGLALEDHELIKVKFLDFKEEKKELSREIAGQLEAVLVGVIGNIAILYKQKPA